jgi:hypothetical protein
LSVVGTCAATLGITFHRWEGALSDLRTPPRVTRGPAGSDCLRVLGCARCDQSLVSSDVKTDTLGAVGELFYRDSVGTIYYGGAADPIHIEDRVLAHLKVVIATKLRRNESFTVSWHHHDQPRGRSTVWLHPSIPLRFVFDDPESPTLSRAWVEELAASANSSAGIVLVPEVLQEPPAERDVAALQGQLSIGKVEIEDLSIDELTVAGTDIRAASGRPLVMQASTDAESTA